MSRDWYQEGKYSLKDKKLVLNTTHIANMKSDATILYYRTAFLHPLFQSFQGYTFCPKIKLLLHNVSEKWGNFDEVKVQLWQQRKVMVQSLGRVTRFMLPRLHNNDWKYLLKIYKNKQKTAHKQSAIQIRW